MTSSGNSVNRSDLERKVISIFRRLVKDKAESLRPTIVPEKAMNAVAEAFANEYSAETAQSIGFHVCDWNFDAACIVAIHLFPEEFTPEEIDEAVWGLLTHVPYHLREAGTLVGIPNAE